jgi:hypothetical protein
MFRVNRPAALHSSQQDSSSTTLPLVPTTVLLPRGVRVQYFKAYPKRYGWSAQSHARRTGRSILQVSFLKYHCSAVASQSIVLLGAVAGRIGERSSLPTT